MKTLILLLMAALSLGASSDGRVDNMVAHCEALHLRDVCRVKLDRRTFTEPTVSIINNGVKVRVDADAYIEMKNEGDNMCAWVRRVCTADWAGRRCFVARNSYRATWPK